MGRETQGFAALSPTERSLNGRVAAHLRWSRTPSKEARRAAFAGANAALRARWAKEADPDGVMTPEELAAAVENLRQAHYARLTLASAKARRARKEGRTAA